MKKKKNNKGITKRDVAYQIITDKVIELLESGSVPWRKPWIDGPSTRSFSGRSYRGINQMLLSSISSIEGLRGCWITFNQVKKSGGHIKKGEHGIPVVLWKWINYKNEDSESADKKFPLCRYYRVFSLCQTEGIETPSWVAKLNDIDNKIDPIEAAENIWSGFENKPQLTFGGDKAAYWPELDRISMPERDRFLSSEHFYSTLFHEASHHADSRIMPRRD
jgi:antirestriction protein ArdC